MKKTLFFIMILAVLATSCKKEKSKSLNYSDSDPITIALRDYHQINVSSEYDITYSTSNDMVVTVTGGGQIYGKNVGSADITMSNGHESKTVEVNVDLFIEPTFEFGCSPSYVKALYGNPYSSLYDDNGILRYIYTANTGYSYACGQMDFLFKDGEYIESQVYIREGVDYLLNNYINERFFPYDTVTIYNPFIEDSVSCDLYKYRIDSTVILGKYFSGDQWNETFLFYIPVQESESATEQSIYNVITRKYED